MLFSQTLEYALRAVVCLAQKSPDPLTTRQISDAAQVPASYLSKVLQALGKAQIITATRGIGGGYVLNHPANELSILDVVNAIDPLKRITKCPLGVWSHRTHLCPLHARLDRVLQDAEEAFRQTTFGELLAGPTGNAPLCKKPAVQLGRK